MNVHTQDLKVSVRVCLNVGAMQFIDQINMLTTTKVGSTYLG